uniref:Uncharacterized protein n=1 Tax=Panagrolaimus superbus TaxID=310955 RepID=A0A914ZB95_9BILA
MHRYSNFKATSFNDLILSFSGKFFPDFRSKSINSNIVEPVNAIVYIPLNLNWPGEHNLVVIEFPEGTDFGVEPITLAKDHVQTYLENLIVVGYGKYEFKKNMHIDETPPQMRHTNVPFQRDRYFDEKEGTPNGSHTVISPDCNFIEEATKNEVKCESVAPIYEEPYQSTTITTMTTSLATQTPTKNQENEISVNSKPENNASIIEFQWILLIFLFTVFCF